MAGLVVMEEVTANPLDAYSYTAARFGISSASLKRRQLFRRIFADLAVRLEGAELDALAQLHELDNDLLAHSAAHLTEWVPAVVDSN
jgi:hypothetical protein